jgi:hypothetical protein
MKNRPLSCQESRMEERSFFKRVTGLSLVNELQILKHPLQHDRRLRLGRFQRSKKSYANRTNPAKSTRTFPDLQVKRLRFEYRYRRNKGSSCALKRGALDEQSFCLGGAGEV